MKKPSVKATAIKGDGRVGVFRGTFDPIHWGHITFATQAISSAELDYVYFLPEKIPQHKKAIENFNNRLIMISRAIGPYKNLGLLELPNMNGSVERILPELKNLFGEAKLVFLMGSDVAKTIHQWPDVDSLCDNNELVIGMRKGDDADKIKKMLATLLVGPRRSTIIEAPLPDITSSTLREKIYQDNSNSDIPDSVHQFAHAKHLYRASLTNPK